jgi:hypothetical protein
MSAIFDFFGSLQQLLDFPSVSRPAVTNTLPVSGWKYGV